MKVERVNLHNLTVELALDKALKNLEYCLNHGVDVIDFNHGKGLHSNRSFSVVKKEIRKMLKDNMKIRDSGFVVVYGESNSPVALTFDEGHTLVVAREKVNEYIGGKTQQEKNKAIYSSEGKKNRKYAKKMHSSKINPR